MLFYILFFRCITLYRTYENLEERKYLNNFYTNQKNINKYLIGKNYSRFFHSSGGKFENFRVSMG